MDRIATPSLENDPLAFLAGGGEMGARTRAFDWSQTPAGPVDSWPHSLKTAVSICLGSRHPMCLWWGKEALTQFYNDGFISFLGATKHPGALGQSAKDCWSEIWHIISEMLAGVFSTGEATWSEDFLYVLNRNLPREEGYFTFSYSAIRDDTGAVAGIFCACSETTGRVLGERRLRTLRDLGQKVTVAKSPEQACDIAAETLASNPHDIPFSLICLLDDAAKHARVVCTSGFDTDDVSVWPPIDIHESAEQSTTWRLRRVFATGDVELISDPAAIFGKLPGGPWPESPEAALILPITAPAEIRPIGLLVAGLSPRRIVDADYRSFFDLIAGHIGTAIANARAYEQERRRAEALAEIDRAKTTFFSNVSHEFRTPLTLMLGPTDDLLAMRPDLLAPDARELVTVVHRNALRLQKLVNALLDFSRIEAGRIQASYEPTDLATLTGELASNFRSAVEKAGMALRVDCPPLTEPIYVDRDMWEKVVLNLVSNAFKFTLHGEIEVKLSDSGAAVHLSVRDTGVGIPEEQLPHIFERFRRVEGTRARTHEGTGIGLSLVQELVKLHGGTVRVESMQGKGCTFTVAVPKGTAHLPAEQIGGARTLASTALTASHYIEEAMRWLPDDVVPPPQNSSASPLRSGRPRAPVAAETSSRERQATESVSRPRIVWADDNADMRDYVRRLLSEHYEVEAVADGEAALAAARRDPPDLVLADVMMPRLDGFGLLDTLRSDERTRTLPIILLSARAAEESRVEGLEAGADDYLIKPFSAKELLARVGSQLELGRLRRQVADVLRESDRRKDEFLAMLSHELRNPLSPILTALQLMRLKNQSSREQDVIERQVRTLMRLVDDLLDVSRITLGKVELRKERLEVAEAAARAIEMASPLLEQKRQILAVHIPPRGLIVDGDPARLAQVFANLLTNAAKYSDTDTHIVFAAERADGQVRIRVKDEGIGLSPEMQNRVFDLFVQDRHAVSRSQGGLGLGLAIVRSLIRLQGGTVRARSDGEGKGSEFIVELPYAGEAAAPASPSASIAMIQQAGRGARSAERILVVDDNEDAATLTAEALMTFGHAVRTAADGATALKVAVEFKPTIALLDIALPKMDGYELGEQLRRTVRGRALRLIAVTGYGRSDDRLHSKAVGFDAHLVKPIEIDDVQRLLEQFSDGADAMRDRELPS